MSRDAKAERVQAWKAFLIPSSLFVACLFNAAGIYIIYSGSAVGVVFVCIGFGIIASGLFAFITFQNKERARGLNYGHNEPEPYMPPYVSKKKRSVEPAPPEAQPEREEVSVS